jgi:hypothetical protein
MMSNRCQQLPNDKPGGKEAQPMQHVHEEPSGHHADGCVAVLATLHNKSRGENNDNDNKPMIFRYNYKIE